MFRKSYRRLLRWNDEFPFAKFSVADDERPLLAVEIPIEEADADALGLAIARILGIADRLLDESKDWLWLGGRMPDMGDRTSANGAFLDRYAARLPELLEAEEAVEPGRRRTTRSSPRSPCRPWGPAREPPPRDPAPRARRRDRLAGHARRHVRGPRRHAGPDDRRRTPATTSSPTQQRVRVTRRPGADQPPEDTATKRYYFDRAFLAVLPGASGFKLTSQGSRSARAAVSKKTSTYTLLQLNLGRRIYSGKTDNYKLVFDLVDKGGAATRDVRVGSSLVSFPVWAFATDSTPGQHGQGRPSRPATRSRSSRATSRRPTTDADGTITLPDRQARQAAHVLRLPRRRSTGLLRRADRDGDRSAGQPVELTIRAWADDTAWSERVGGLVSRGLPVLAEQIGLPWPRDGGLVVHETVSRTTGGYAGLFDPSAGQVEVAYYAGDFVVLHESAHAWFNGGLLADRWANEAFASYYGLEAAKELEVKATGDELTPELEAARIPLNAWGAVGREDDEDRGLRLRRDARPRARDRRAGRSGRPARGLGRCRGQGRCLPAGRDRRGNGRGRRRGEPNPRPSTDRPTGAGCSTCSRSGPA